MKTGAERFNAEKVYKVEKVTESIEYNPSQQLSKKQVQELCEASGWKVTVTEVK